MRPIHSILVPIDFEDASRAALRLALELAKGFGAAVTMLHVFQEPADVFRLDEVFGPDITERAAKAAQHQLAALRKEQTGAVAVDAHVCKGVPSKEIVAWAGARQCDLIVMGTHGRTGLDRLTLGSIAERVLRLAPCPVLTVHS